MTTIVLIHGGWHGGWCWKKLVPLLRLRGHDVHAPTLTGLGERAHLLSPAISLSTHVQDIVALLTYEDLQEVMLVGHSYGGMVMTGVAEAVPHRLTQLVYLDAFVPQDGQALADLADPAFYAGLEARAKAEGEGWRVPPPPLARWGITEESDLNWMRDRVGPHPLKTFKEPVHLHDQVAATLPRTFIYCTDKPTGDSLAPLAKRLREKAGWRYRELPAGHDVMVTAPKDVAAMLDEISRAAGHALGAESGATPRRD